jgi:hypothetical protein
MDDGVNIGSITCEQGRRGMMLCIHIEDSTEEIVLHLGRAVDHCGPAAVALLMPVRTRKGEDDKTGIYM